MAENSVSKPVRWLLYALLVAVALGAMGFLAVFGMIENSVEVICDEALQAQQMEGAGQEVPALIAQLQSDTTTLREKNRIIWALGRLRDKRALPVLEALVTGEKCDHSKYVCQRELKRAIERIE